jgi:hypothetical protein
MDGKNKYSGFCFTSSSAVFPDNIDCDDDTATLKLGANPRADRLLNAENVVLEHENRRKEKKIATTPSKTEKKGKTENYQIGSRAAFSRIIPFVERCAHILHESRYHRVASRCVVNCIHDDER